jgi:hypothetical protein
MSEVRSLKPKVDARRTGHGRDAGAAAGAICRSSRKARALRIREQAGTAKKECLISTNEAIMLLKTKDRQNERSQTKPISAGGKIGCGEQAMLNYEF